MDTDDGSIPPSVTPPIGHFIPFRPAALDGVEAHSALVRAASTASCAGQGHVSQEARQAGGRAGKAEPSGKQLTGRRTDGLAGQLPGCGSGGAPMGKGGAGRRPARCPWTHAVLHACPREAPRGRFGPRSRVPRSARTPPPAPRLGLQQATGARLGPGLREGRLPETPR